MVRQADPMLLQVLPPCEQPKEEPKKVCPMMIRRRKGQPNEDKANDKEEERSAQ